MSHHRSPRLSGGGTNVDQARRRWVAGLVRRHGVPEGDVEDVTQNVMIAIHRAAPISVPEGRSPEEAWRAWCRGVVRRQVASHRRELWQSLPGEVDPAVSVEGDPTSSFDRGAMSGLSSGASTAVGLDPSASSGLDPSVAVPLDPEELLIASQETARARLALEELRARRADRHAVLVAYEIDERPISEIAASLGITVNTCWNRLRLAREDLRAVWKRLRATSDNRSRATSGSRARETSDNRARATSGNRSRSDGERSSPPPHP